MTTKDQTTLPTPGPGTPCLHVGDRVESQPGACKLSPRRRPVKQLKGLLADKVTRPVSIEEMNEAGQQAVAERYRRLSEP